MAIYIYSFQKHTASGCSKIPVPLKYSGLGHQQPSLQMKDDFCDIMNEGDMMMIPEEVYRNQRQVHSFMTFETIHLMFYEFQIS